MTPHLISMAAVLSVVIGSVTCSNILFLSPHTCYSHTSFFLPVIKELASRGHSITYWNGLKPREPMANVTHLYSEELHEFNSNHHVGYIGFGLNNPFLFLPKFMNRFRSVCRMVYNDRVFHQLINSDTKYDLIVIDAFINECMLPIVKQLDVPFIYLSSLLPLPYHFDVLGSPLTYAHFPVLATEFTDEMDLWQRTANALSGMIFTVFRNQFLLPIADRMAAQAWSGLNMTFPPVAEIEANVSLLITNAHLSLNSQFPKMATIVEAGGLHFEPTKPLPQDLEEFIEDSGDAGFILFSFGSLLHGSHMPEATEKIFMRTFARLPQHVLWKWEDDHGMANISSNVKLAPWLPQVDLLGHPKIRLFITHGGSFSNQEAVFHGVPLISFPVFGDQPHYARRAEKDGYGIRLNWMTITEDILYDAIQEILTESRYTERVRQISRILHDQMDRPLDRAVFAIEYVIRHQGAPHLRAPASRLTFYQRGLLDVTLLLAFFVMLMAYFTYRFVRSLSPSNLSSQKMTMAHPKTCH